MRAALVVDKSGSMASYWHEAIKQMQIQLQALGPGTKLFAFSSHVEQASTLAYLTPDGQTALFDGVGAAIEGLDYHVQEPVLIVTITDGYENASHNYTATRLMDRIRQLQSTDWWTFVFQVPASSVEQMARLGVPAGNIRAWDQTVGGLRETSLATQTGYAHYFDQIARGAKSIQNFYHTTDLSHLTVREVGKLEDVTQKFTRLPVIREEEIRDLVEHHLGRYVLGSAYYQLTKREKIQQHKAIILGAKNSRTLWGGHEVRATLGLPTYGDGKVTPGNHANYDIFVQSTSTNRKLVRGTTLLVEK